MSGRASSEKLIQIVKVIFFAAFMTAVVGLLYFSARPASRPMDIDEPVFLEDWTVTTPDGDVVQAGRTFRNTDGLKGTFRAVSTLPEDTTEDSLLSFIVGGNVAVYINGELRKDFDETRDIPLPGGCVKRFYMVIPLDHDDSGGTVEIVRTGTTRSGYIYQQALVTTSGGLYEYLMSEYGLSLMLSEIIWIFSLVIVIISIAMRIMYRRRIELLYGALAILVIATWLITNSYLYPFIYGRYHIDGVMNYLMCLMMPFNLVFYMDALQHGRYRGIMKATLVLSTASLIVWPVLHFAGIIPFPSALIYIDLLLGIEILVVMALLIIDAIRGRSKEYLYTAIGIGGFLFCGLLEIVFLIIVPILQNDVPMLAGLAFLLALAVVQQVHDLKTISDERQKAVALSEAKTRFLASMSHEIRTPINSVLGMNEMIIRENKDPVIGDYAESVKSAGQMLLMLVNDVLDFSKIEAGKLEIASVDYRLSTLLRDIAPMLKSRADDKGLKLSTLILNEVPDGQRSDEFRIRQILINLINNAIKYTDSGSVTLMVGGEYTDQDNYNLRLSIRDTGRGISEEDQKHLFEAFTRADLKKNSNIEGTGLGLAIVKSIVDSMGGTIGVQSKYGEGSEFIINLPVGVTDREPLPENFMERTDRTASGTGACDYSAPAASILAVDDNAANLRIVSLFLKRPGIVPDTVDGGAKAIERCKHKKYDLILLDHMMPEPDGIETLNAIRNDAYSMNRETPVIVLTANAVAGSRQMYMDAGFVDYLTKPLDSAVLEQTVKKYLPEGKIEPPIGKKHKPYEVPAPAPEAVESSEPDDAPIEIGPMSPLKARLTAIDGLNYDTALSYAGGDEGLLSEMVQSISDECPEKIRSMREALEAGDLESYRLSAHSIKGLMLMAGLPALSERAKKHEFAARDEDIDFLHEDCDGFLKQYEEVCSGLSSH